jgi:hypothetical protein
MFKSIPECLIRRTKYTNIGSDVGTTWEEGGSPEYETTNNSRNKHKSNSKEQKNISLPCATSEDGQLLQNSNHYLSH